MPNDIANNTPKSFPNSFPNNFPNNVPDTPKNMPVTKTRGKFTASRAIETLLAGSILLSMTLPFSFGLAAQQYNVAPPNQPQYNPADNSQDPPSRVARISVVSGNVSLEPAGVNTFSQAEINYPLTAGDRVYVDNTSESELQSDGLAVRLGNGADLTLSTLTDAVAQFGLAQGSIRLRTRDPLAFTTSDGSPAAVEVDTPNGTIVVSRAGDIRVDSYPQDDTTVVTVSSGEVEITGPNLDTRLGPNQSVRLAGTNPVYTQALRLLPPDQLDNFDQSRERERQQATAASAPYVDPGMVGVADLGQYGDWNPQPEYGAVWFPRAVPAGWTPYSNGHWAWVAPWGWTWVEAEAWGFTPFHYGRWAAFGPPEQARWGWIPGPPPSVFEGQRAWRPVYSPALVAFVGGPRFSVSLGFGASSGAGVTAWFPLGPHEAYQPWYHASPAYVNRVNVTNIYNRNVNEIRETYNNRTTNVFTTNVTNVTYVNRPVATVAVAQRDFSSGRAVAESQHIRLDANSQRILSQAPILPHPLVTPQIGAAAPQAPARALPPNQARPVVGMPRSIEPAAGSRAGTPGAPANPSGQDPNLTRPGSPRQPPTAVRTPVRAYPQPGLTVTSPADPPRSLPAANQIPVSAQQPRNGGEFPSQRDHAPVEPGQAPQRGPQQAPPQAPVTQQGPARQQAPAVQVQPQPAPARVQAPTAIRNVTSTPASASFSETNRTQGDPGRPVQRPPDAQRPLINRTVPQLTQPSFPQQQRAMQATDPGRPLGPQQVNNLRQGLPAGRPTQPEAVAHPAPVPAATRSAAPTARPGLPAPPVDPKAKPAPPKP